MTLRRLPYVTLAVLGSSLGVAACSLGDLPAGGHDATVDATDLENGTTVHDTSVETPGSSSETSGGTTGSDAGGAESGQDPDATVSPDANDGGTYAAPDDGSCDGGACCPAGYLDCDQDSDVRCATSIRNDPAHCGACKRACSAGSICVNEDCYGGFAAERFDRGQERMNGREKAATRPRIALDSSDRPYVAYRVEGEIAGSNPPSYYHGRYVRVRSGPADWTTAWSFDADGALPPIERIPLSMSRLADKTPCVIRVESFDATKRRNIVQECGRDARKVDATVVLEEERFDAIIGRGQRVVASFFYDKKLHCLQDGVDRTIDDLIVVDAEHDPHPSSIVEASTGHIYVAYLASRPGTTKTLTAISWNGSTWGTPEDVDIRRPVASRNFSMAVGPGGRPYIAYYIAGERKIWLAHRGDEKWEPDGTVADLPAEADMKALTLAFDPHGVPHIVYYSTHRTDGTGMLWYTILNGQRWWSLSMAKDCQDFIDLAIDSRGKPHILCEREYLHRP